MAWLRAFGSRNHPKTIERRRAHQKAREGMAVTPEMLANYTAARAFLLGEWFGASLMAASIGMVYLFAAASDVPAQVNVSVSLALLALGSFVYWRNRQYYARLGFPWAKRWDTAALVLAGSGAVFWILFGLLWILTAVGVPILRD